MGGVFLDVQKTMGDRSVKKFPSFITFYLWIDICAHIVRNCGCFCFFISGCGVASAGCADLMFEMLVDFSNFLKRQSLRGKSSRYFLQFFLDIPLTAKKTTVERQNVTFMVSEGTLLGAVRDQESFVGCPQHVAVRGIGLDVFPGYHSLHR